jgi:nitronate monooxygenase
MIRDLLELPIIQAPMAGVQTSPLAIAVCNAGGIGSLPCAMLSPAQIRDEIAKIRAATTRPYNVNFFCHAPREDVARERAWRTALMPYYAELGIDPAAAPAGPRRAPFDDAAADVVEELRPPIVSFHFGLPSDALLVRVRATGAKILASATTIDEARWLEAKGVDAIVAQGVEAGGHRGMFLADSVAEQVGTLALVPQIIAATKLPVIAAGGIADARGVEAALALGAVAAQIGTAYLLCPEATTSPLHRAALASDRAKRTAITNVFTGRPARAIVNRLVEELGPMSGMAPPFPLASAAVTPLRAEAERRGSDAFSQMWSGQNATGCKPVPAAHLTRELGSSLARR